MGLGMSGCDGAQSEVVELLDYQIHVGTQQSILELLKQRLHARVSTHVVTLNPEIVVGAKKNPELRQALAQSNVIVADGVGLCLAGFILRRGPVRRYPGVDLAHDLMAELAQTGGRVYFLGARPGVGDKAALRLLTSFPGLAIVGIKDGYFSDSQSEDVAKAIAAAKPDLLLAGMGSPRQELFIARYRELMNVPLMVGVGGAIDVFAGIKARAPGWMRRSGTEWVFRVLQDLSRVKRLGVLPGFLSMVLREAMRRTA